MSHLCEWPRGSGCNKLQPETYHLPGLPTPVKLCRRHSEEWDWLLKDDPRRLFETFGLPVPADVRARDEPTILPDAPPELDPKSP
jgi:hypothetical protein